MLQGKIGKTEKNLKENHATKVTKIPKTKTRKYGMNETHDSIFYCRVLLGMYNFDGATESRLNYLR